jgi:hypothetical protein
VWTTGVTVTLTLVLTALVLGWAIERHRRTLKASRFRSREPIPVEQLVAAYVTDDAESRVRLVYWWKRAASILRIDAELLRPDDRFDRELAPVPGFPIEDELVELNELRNYLKS